MESRGLMSLKRGSELKAGAKAVTGKAKAAAIERWEEAKAKEAEVKFATNSSGERAAGTVIAADSRTKTWKPADSTTEKKTRGVATQFPGAPKSGANGGQQPVFKGEYKGLSCERA
jgi:hypothetical protein